VVPLAKINPLPACGRAIMTGPPPFRRYGTEQDDVEAIPLSSTEHPSEPWYQERDLADERLPSYNEALADPPPSIPATNTAYDHGIEMPPGALGARRRPVNQHSQKRLYNMAPCLLGPFIALVISAVFRFIFIQDKTLTLAAPRT